MPEPLDFATVVAGGLTTLGVVLDWGTDPGKKKRLQKRLKGLLHQFEGIKFRTFGRKEIEFSMRVFELLGTSFFSWRRLAVVAVMYAVLGIALLVAFASRIGAVTDYLPEAVINVFISAVFLSLSISYTIWISRLVLRLPGGPTLLGTCILLIVHLVLFIFWRPIVMLAAHVGSNLLFADADLALDYLLDFWRLLKIMGEAIAGMGLWPMVQKTIEIFYRISLPAPDPTYYDLARILGSLTALLANALRIVMACVFVAGFTYVVLVRPLLVWFWSALIRSSALFSPPLSAIAAIIFVLNNWSRITDALLRPFQY